MEIIGKENRCSVCGTPQVLPFVRIHSLDVRGARIAVALFHCSEHGDFHKVWDYSFVNGVLMLEMPGLKFIGKWFNLSWSEFQKMVYSRTEFANTFPRYELNKAFEGYGYLCHKTVDVPILPNNYVFEPIKVGPEKHYPSVDLENTYTTDNIHQYHFHVPKEVYSVKAYYDRLNNARTLGQVEKIIEEFKSKKEKTLKKHWWKKT